MNKLNLKKQFLEILLLSVMLIIFLYILTIQILVVGGEFIPDLVSEKIRLVLMATLLLLVIGFIYRSEKKKKLDIFDLLYHNNNAAIMIWKTDGTVIDVNERYEDLIGYGKDLIGKNWLEYTLDENEDFELDYFVAELVEKKRIQNYVSRAKTKNGYVNMVWNDIYLESEGYIISFGLDLTKELDHQKALYDSLTVDQLTGLENIVLFKEDVNIWHLQKRQFAIYCVNMDNFKNLNDVHGHPFGDMMLKKCASYIHLKDRNFKAYRWQGDTLLVLHEYSSQSDVNDFVKYLENFADITWRLGELEYITSLSVGIVMWDDIEKDAHDALKKIDIALNKAKIQGKNRTVIYSDSLLEEVEKNHRLQTELKAAIKEDAFELYLQPIMNYHLDQVTSFEVLLRWPAGSDLVNNIGEVINFAEKTGQISQIDQLVIEKSFGLLEEEKDAFGQFVLNINVSAQTFTSEWFLEYVCDKLKEHEVDSRQIIFEITEYTFLEKMEKSKETMLALKELGIGVALDDFGTKFSSLNYLVDLPFRYLKIDKMFIDDIVEHRNCQLIVEMLINLSNTLGMLVVAEGIELKEQSQLLKAMSCDYGQGYLHYRPMPIAQVLEEIIKNNIQI